ncbi:MAG: SDR family NAD(P)-dependent oxidoreductase [Nevskiaceae bacterium]|nr:MAG: SDR family NAD(P)-dependent oxidoreductase [Nevskiaceae bacterium]TBR72780.1 MAG: SDR family NAD(P)-dependent oxidoreductase [Nevskiaceae bacterium]
MKAEWTVAHMPGQTGRLVVVTGANGGLGRETCKALARAGATVVMACRDAGKGEAAAALIRAEVPGAKLEVVPLDLAKLASIRAFAAGFIQHHERLDLLINNAGIIGMPLRRTVDGFESMMATDCLGHFALTGLLLDRLMAASTARVVAVGTSSQPHGWGRIDPDDLNWQRRRFNSLRATLQAKLAFQLCTFELARRLAEQSRSQVAALVAHPGIADTDVSLAGPRVAGAMLKLRLLHGFNRVFTQPAAAGALPTLYAATDPAAHSGDYIGPDGFLELRGAPKRLKAGAIMRDRALAARLWACAEALTGVRYLSSGA